MISKSSFHDRTLAESFYRSLLNRFCDSFNSSIQSLLSECTFGIAPSPSGVKTFFIVAPSLEVAQELTESIDSILNEVIELMPGVDQTAICVVPPQSEVDRAAAPTHSPEFPPKFMLGKIFPHPSDTPCLT